METHQIPTIEQIVADPATSYWLKNALKQAIARDPVDALHDAMSLTTILSRRFDDMTIKQQCPSD